MKKQVALVCVLFCGLLILSGLACNLDLSSFPDENQAVEQVSEPDTDEGVIIPDTGAQELSAAEAAVQEATPQPTETPSPTPTTEIIHLTRPGDPASSSYYILDSSTAPYAPEQRSIADNFNINILERPFDAEGMVYKPYLDITRTELYIFAPWVYVTIFLQEAPPAGAGPWYAVEIDLDMDGEGDLLVAGMLPPDTTWTTDGVMVFEDSNNDVAGARVMQADAPPQSGNGYESVVFDQGLGDDPDAAWIRIAPGHPDRMQLGFKYDLLGSDGEFLWGSWADEGLQQAGWFDYHDHFSQAEAGSPLAENSNYPLAELYGMDNTCRWTYGFQPTDPLPGLCPLPATPTPTPTATATPTEAPPSGVHGWVFWDRDSSNSWSCGDTPFIGVPVHLWKDSCGGSGHLTTITNSEGRFGFYGLESGTYCVKVYRADIPGGPWYNTVPGSGTSDPTVSVSPPPGMALPAYFGFTYIVP